MNMDKHDLIEAAFKVTGRYQSSQYCDSGLVGAALLTKAGNVYTGVNLDCACGLGFCAEHSAIAEMLKHKESEIMMIVAVNAQKTIIPPCGRCRELIYQVNISNVDAQIIMDAGKVALLRDLLPDRWQETWDAGKVDKQLY